MDRNYEETMDEDEDCAAQELHDDMFEVFIDHGEALYLLSNAQHQLLHEKMKSLEMIQFFQPSVQISALMAADVKMCSLVLKMLKDKKGEHLAEKGSEIAQLFAQNPQYRDAIRDLFSSFCYEKLNNGGESEDGEVLINKIRQLCDGKDEVEQVLEPTRNITSQNGLETRKRSHPTSESAAINPKNGKFDLLTPFYPTPSPSPYSISANEKISAAAKVYGLKTKIGEENEEKEEEHQNREVKEEMPFNYRNNNTPLGKLLKDFNLYKGTIQNAAHQIITLTYYMCGGQDVVHEELKIMHVFRSSSFIKMQNLMLPPIFSNSVDVMSLLAVDYEICASTVRLIREKKFQFSCCGWKFAKSFVENPKKRTELRRIFGRFCDMKLVKRDGISLVELMMRVRDICGVGEEEARNEERMKQFLKRKELRVETQKTEHCQTGEEEFVEVEGEYHWENDENAND